MPSSPAIVHVLFLLDTNTPLAQSNRWAVADNQPQASSNQRATQQNRMPHNPIASFAARLEPWFECSNSSPTSPTTHPREPFDRLALDLFAIQFHQVHPYQNFCRHLGRTPENVRHWSDIPCVPTPGFKEFELTSVPPAKRVVTFHSSGTTAHLPARHFHSAHSLHLYQAAARAWFVPHLLPDQTTLRFVSLTPDSSTAPRSSLACMLHSLMDLPACTRAISSGLVQHDDAAWYLDLARLLSELESSCADGEPVLLAGTAFGFVHLLDTLGSRSLRFSLPQGSRVMETGGYKGRSRILPKPELHRRLTTSLGIPDTHIVTEYGMTELSSQAYDRTVGSAHPRRFLFPPWCRTRVVSPETNEPVQPGATGLLQVFDLANVGSVLAVQTEDLVVVADDGFDYLGRANPTEARGCSLMHA